MQTATAKPLAEKVRELRLAAGMTQEDLAAASGLTRPTIQNIERGRRVYRTTVRLVAEALETTVAELTEVTP